jgi:hypothetical protein
VTAAILAACGARTGLGDPAPAAAAPDAGGAEHVDAGLQDHVDTGPSDAARPDVGGRLNGLRWELPCREPRTANVVCTCDNDRVVSTSFGGAPGDRYLVTLRFRGVVETKDYVGGVAVGEYFQIGGTPRRDDNWNAYALEISSPPGTYYINRGVTGLYRCFAIDYTAVVRVDGGATLTLRSSAYDGREIMNVDERGLPFVIPGVPPAPSPYDGQFIQVDVVAAEPAP